ncbi:MAG: MBL fold metallo-hydrolase [Candidatus Hodarchaeota archaeon]
MVKVKILFLGTAASAFSKDRNPTSIIVHINDKAILLDCGPGVTRRCVENGIDLRKIEKLYISHGHNDHLIDITSFLWQNWLGSDRKNELEIITQGYVVDRIKNLISLVSTPEDAMKYDLNFIDITKEPPLKDFALDIGLAQDPTDLKITRRHVKGIHDPPSSGIRLDINVTSENKVISICYSGDTAPSDSICELAKDCTYLIHEATFLDDEEETATMFNHSTPSGAGKIASKANVGNLVLIHYSNALEGKEDLIKAQASKEFDGNIIIARDLMEIQI